MSRPRASALAGGAIALLLAVLGGGAIAIVRTLPATDLATAGLAWATTASAAILGAAAGAATIAWIAKALGEGWASAVATSAGAAALAGASVVVLVASGSPAIPVTGAAVFVVAAEAVERAGRPVIVRRRARLAAIGLGLLVSELFAVAGALGLQSAAAWADPLLLAGAALLLVALLARLAHEAAAETAAILVGVGTLAIARAGTVEIPIGLGFLAAGCVLLARRAVTTEEPMVVADEDGDRLPELAARLSDAVLRFDGRLRLADWNATAATLLGLDPASSGTRIEDLLGIPITALPAHDAMVTAERGVGGLDIAIHRSGGGLTAIIRDPARAPETERLGRELRGTVDELLQARRTIDLQRTEIERAARIDALTGLPSRPVILERLASEIAEANRYRHPIAIVMLDLDDFTALNREHGTAVGDAVLREVALRMRLRVRTADALGRLGGDGFLAILPHTDDGGAATFADALRRRLAARPVAAGSVQLGISLSAGVATMRAGEGLGVDDLLGRVEEALSSAREAGGNRVALDRRHGLARLDAPTPPEPGRTRDDRSG